MRYFAVVAIVLLAACTGNRGPVPMNVADRSSAQEDFQIRLSPQQSQALIVALQQKLDLGAGVQFNVAPLFLPEQTAQVTTSAYVRAFDDARAKAQRLAAHIGAHLSSAHAIAEVQSLGTPYAVSSALPAGPMPNLLVMRANTSPNSPITLAVTFNLSGEPGATISVFGLSAAGAASPSIGNARGLRITLTARASDIRTAANRLHDADDAIRTIARESGVSDAAFAVYSSNFGSY